MQAIDYEARYQEREAQIRAFETLQGRLGQQPKSIHDAVFAFRAMFRWCPFPAWLKNAEGYMLAKNPAYMEVYGKSKSDDRYIGLRDAAVWPDETAERYDANDKEALEHGSIVKHEQIYNEMTHRTEALDVAKWTWGLENGDRVVVGVVTGNIPMPSCARYDG